MLAGVTMIESVLYRPDPRELRYALASEKLVELHPPLPGFLR